MSHELHREAIDREFSGEPLDPQAAAHVETCDECRAYREKLVHVDAVLARGAMGQARQDALEARLFAKLSEAPVPPAAPVPLRSRPGFMIGGLLAAIAAVVLVVLAGPLKEDEFAPRGSKAQSFGVRAFCVDAGKVVAEARENQTLRCGDGQLVQLSYTAASAAELVISMDGDDVVLPKTAVNSGVDVPLSFSTPVGEWLQKPRSLKWRFEVKGAPVEGGLTISR